MDDRNGFIGVDTARSSYDTVDGETVVLDVTTGVLTLLVGIGPAIWARLVDGADRSALLAEISDTYGDDAGSSAGVFLDALVAAELVVPRDDPGTAATAPAPWPAEYQPPEVERYDDIADIMTMDPIHEVDTTRGWPRQADPAGDGSGDGAHGAG
ncbi:MAG: hypothetical protein U0W40_16790 [Acidimicrobiia bacterium]